MHHAKNVLLSNKIMFKVDNDCISHSVSHMRESENNDASIRVQGERKGCSSKQQNPFTFIILRHSLS